MGFDITKVKPTTIEKLEAITMLVYGKAGRGKTTFATSFPKALLVDIEGTGGFTIGANRVTVDYIKDVTEEMGIKNQEEAEKMTGLMEVFREFFKSDYQTLILDGVNPLVKMFENKTCKSMGRTNMRQHKYGDTYGEMREEFTTMLSNLMKKGKNLVLITHEDTEEEINEADDTVITTIVPYIKDKELKSTIPAFVDNIGYMYTVENGEEKTFMIDFSPFGKTLGKNRFGINEPMKADFEVFKKKVEEAIKSKKIGGNK